MNRVIVAVGGTGQMAVHYYAQLYLTGFIGQPFRAIVLDTDDFAPSLNFLSEFFRDVATALGPSGKNTVPTIELKPLNPQNKVGLVSEILAAKALPAQPGFHHAVQAYFSAQDLKENVMQGLYARPALSAVLALDESLRCLDTIEPASVVTLVSSCTGGTGGGLSIPVLWRLETRPGANLQLRAALLGDFFTSTSEQDSIDDQDNRFRSNRLLFLKAMEETVTNLQRYRFIEEPRMVRDKTAEKATRTLPWPDEKSPYWQAVSAVDALLNETVSDAGGGSLEVPPLKHDLAEASLNSAVARVRSFVKHSVLDRLRGEAFVEQQWGENLPACICSYAQFADGKISKFVRDVQSEVEKAWHPPAANDYGLAHVFPQVNRAEAYVKDIVSCDWRRAPGDLEASSLGGPSVMRHKIARLFLYTLLRRGGRS